MKYISIILGLTLSLGIVNFSFAQDKVHDKKEISLGPHNKQLVLNKFTEFMGLNIDELNQADIEINLVLTQQDTSNLLLHSLINNRHAWSVTFKQIKVGTTTNSHGDSVVTIRDFEVFMDLENGNFLKAVSRSPDSILLSHNPWEELLEEPNNNPDKYELTLLNQPPATKLLDALKKTKRVVRDSKEITAYLLIYNYKNGNGPYWIDENPKWCIVSKNYNLIADSLSQDGYNIYPSAFYEYIDASTGNKLFTMSHKKLPNAPK